MNLDNVEYMPIWISKATPAERFEELALLARKKPERFSRVAVVYCEIDDEGKTYTRFADTACNTHELMGLLEDAKMEVFRCSRIDE